MAVRHPCAYSLSRTDTRSGPQTPLRPRIRNRHTYQLWNPGAGAEVVVNDLDGHAVDRTARALLVAWGICCIAAPGDVTATFAVGEVIAAALGLAGHHDVLVNNARVLANAPPGGDDGCRPEARDRRPSRWCLPMRASRRPPPAVRRLDHHLVVGVGIGFHAWPGQLLLGRVRVFGFTRTLALELAPSASMPSPPGRSRAR